MPAPLKFRKNNRQKAFFYGRFAEHFCCWSLRCRGYKIIAHNFKTPVGEIDIIAKRGKVLAFIEVKARSDRNFESEVLTLHQRRRIERAASWYLMQNNHTEGLDIRFDLMRIKAWGIPHHLPNAWQ